MKSSFFMLMAVLMLSSTTVEARKAPKRGWNYIENGHLYVWYNGHYEDMGAYTP